jgi:four helix bundle protein
MNGFKNPEEFDAWKLSWELKERVVAFTATDPAARDRKCCEEILESARSAPDNIAEGFYRFNPPDFANFVRIARGSLGEGRNQLRHAHSTQVSDRLRVQRTQSSLSARNRCVHRPSPLSAQPSEKIRSPKTKT